MEPEAVLEDLASNPAAANVAVPKRAVAKRVPKRAVAKPVATNSSSGSGQCTHQFRRGKNRGLRCTKAAGHPLPHAVEVDDALPDDITEAVVPANTEPADTTEASWDHQ